MQTEGGSQEVGQKPAAGRVPEAEEERVQEGGESQE